MLREGLYNEYFDWLYHLVCGDYEYNRVSYRNLLDFLFNTEFTYTLLMDENRALAGIDFRRRFAYETGHNVIEIDRYFANDPCNVLEMMISLAFKVEEHIMSDNEYGDRTGQWFWNMIVSLGLGAMDDNNFNEAYVYRVVCNFLDRNYEPNGRGGLFTIDDCPFDLREVPIWSQCMWYLDAILYDHL